MPHTRRNALKMILAGAATAAAPGLARSAANSDGRPALRVAVSDLPSTLEPADAQSLKASAYRVLNSMFDNPLEIDASTYQIGTSLAESVNQVSETAFDLTFREKVFFHDNTPMSIDDVIFSFGDERMMVKGAPGYAVKQLFLTKVAKVEKLGEHTARFHLTSSDPVFTKRLAAWGGQVISQKAFGQRKSFAEWGLQPIGTGPYKLGSFLSGDHVELVAFDDYWRKKPPFSAVRFQQVPELATRVVGLLAGDYDIIADVSPDQMNTITKDPRFEIVGGAPAGYQMIMFDINGNPLLRDVNLRRAMNLAVDRKLIVDSLWQGRVTVPNGHQLPVYGDLYDPGRAPLEYNPDRARELLRQSNYKGEEIPYRMVPTYYTNQLATGQVLVEMWRSVGINVRLETVQDISQVYREGAGHLVDGSSVMFYPDPVSTSWRRYGANSPYQATWKMWSNEEYNQLGKILESSTDINARKKAFQRMLDIIEWEDPTGVLLYTTGYFYAKRKDADWKPHFLPNMNFI
ncbi:ABC transporter substrate-binding protein [Rhizobium leguminosarum]|uniref:ABC transporter substrate-binding protein n=1 Tax=Rhizobium leguminosarum TaxID=384 RepID=UPI001C961969|nr:ABC transporter substrate-binding protein [Rhizobium leguminosarum]MBY5361911.1 ABC transporter substrate-binding protein [Rhizobium leguminosarum]MBY5664941.1 ABC transporter substrate-binding protein [Rhizobium leguminosarum]MBY5677575.1 ABC transporter substrate-binding protein [Rhizobium leguminosarum]